MRVLRWSLRVVVVLVVVLLVAGCGGYLYLRGATTPDLDGTLDLDGLSRRATIERDSKGVPHIKARNERDLFFALGVAHAQDRLWQMEFQRRVGAGRLSEVLGEATVDQDRFLRTAGFYRASQRAYRSLSGRSREDVDGYVEGINAYLATDPDLPVEFRLLGYEPEEWRPADVLVWAKMMSFDLSANYESELTRYRLRSSGVSPKRIEALLPPYPSDAPTILKSEDLGAKPSEGSGEQAAALLKNRRSMPESLEASNDWVVSGERTKSGSPLLANDPHLGLQVPSLWYLADLKSPTLRAVGATLPGLPAVVIGRNDEIAWGVTNVGADVQDLYVMDETEDGEGYRYKGKRRDYDIRDETIEVKDAKDVKLKVRGTVYGPVVSDVVDAPEDSEPLALRWTTLDPDDATIEGFLGVDRAGDWGEFNDALRSYVAPSQNFVYADVDGNIGYVAPGRFPVRAKGHTGLAPAPGDGRYDWRGYIPFDEWPRTLNPGKGYIATANNKAVPDDYPHDISLEWAEPYRAERIGRMIEAKDDLTREDMVDIQQDRKSLLFEDFRPVLRRMETESSTARDWRQRLLDWDGVASPDSREASLFAAWYSDLTKLPAKEVKEEHWEQPRYLLSAFEDGDPNCEPATAEGCMEFASGAFGRALSRFDGDPPEWGDIHEASFVHPVLGQTPLSRLSDRSVAFGGDSSTVNVGSYDPEDFTMSAGPSYRHVVDLSQVENSLFVHPMGQSGNLLSKDFDDLLPMWRDGEYLPMKTSGYDADDTLTLRPTDSADGER